MALHREDNTSHLEDTEGGTGIVPSPAIFDFLQQLLGAQPGGALANAPVPSPVSAASIGIGRPPQVPTGIQSAPPPGTPSPPSPAVTRTELPSSPITGGAGLDVLSGVEGLDDAGLGAPSVGPTGRPPTSGIGRAAAGTVGSGAAPGAGGDNALIQAILQLLSGGGGQPNVNPIGRAVAATR